MQAQRRSSRALFKNVPVLDSGARGATTTFMERGIGDVLLAWENEAYLALAEAKDKVEIVMPSMSMLAEPSVAVVDGVVDRRGTRDVARAYWSTCIPRKVRKSPRRHHYRPRDAQVASKYAGDLCLAEAVHHRRGFGGWQAAQKAHFADGGIFDHIYKPGAANRQHRVTCR